MQQPSDWTVFWTGTMAITGVVSLGVLVAGIILTLNQIKIGRRDSRVKYTTDLLAEAVSPEMREANLALNPAGQSLVQTRDFIKRAFDHFTKMKYDLNAEGVDRRVMNALGLYSNLYDKAAAYSEKEIIDDDLWFGQQALTMVMTCAMIGDFIVPGGVRGESILAKFARRGLAYLESKQPNTVTDDLRSFYH